MVENDPKTRLRMFSSKDQTWSTPQWLFDKLNSIFGFELDPCAETQTAKCKNYYTKEEDGLKQDWSKFKSVYVNPPFSKELPLWCKKCYEEASKCNHIVMLISARTDTKYWQDYCFKASAICFIKGRLKFESHNSPERKPRSAPFPSAIIIFGNPTFQQLQELRTLGTIVKPIEVMSNLPDKP